MANEKTTFQAKANVNFCVNLTRFEEVRAYNKSKLAEMREIDPQFKGLGYHFFSQYINKDTVLTFGPFEFDEETGRVLVYPTACFDEWHKSIGEEPCQSFGKLDESLFNEQLDALSPKAKAAALAEMKKNSDLSPFVLTRFVEKI